MSFDNRPHPKKGRHSTLRYQSYGNRFRRSHRLAVRSAGAFIRVDWGGGDIDDLPGETYTIFDETKPFDWVEMYLVDSGSIPGGVDHLLINRESFGFGTRIYPTGGTIWLRFLIEIQYLNPSQDAIRVSTYVKGWLSSGRSGLPSWQLSSVSSRSVTTGAFCQYEYAEDEFGRLYSSPAPSCLNFTTADGDYTSTDEDWIKRTGGGSKTFRTVETDLGYASGRVTTVDPTVTVVPGVAFEVQSSKYPEVWYEVPLNYSSCTCGDFTQQVTAPARAARSWVGSSAGGFNPCKHIMAVMAKLGVSQSYTDYIP